MAIEDKDITQETSAKELNGKDLEKNFDDTPPESIKEEDAIAKRFPMVRKLATYGVELRGIQPVPVEERKDTRIINLFSLWFTASTCLLPIATGMSATLSYGLSLRDASLIIIFFTLLSCTPVAWMGMLGPKTGMRQMIQARYYFGLYLIAIIVLLQLATLTGFTIISAIVSGQTLSAISGGSLSLSVGIVITALIGLGISFMGYKFLHNFERYSWIPTLIAIVITVGCGGKDLFLQAETEAPAASTILSYGSIVAGFLISWSTLVSDFAVYISPEVPKLRIFSYVYVGLALPTILLMILGAAIGGAVPNVPAWAAADLADSTGGVMRAMLLPAGGFGKFVAVLLAFSVIGNVGASLYSISVNFQVVLPFLVHVPRYLFSIVITAILIPVSIVVAKNFYESLGNFLGVIGYWAAAFIGIALTEHHFFRHGDPASYDPSIWNVGSKLPMGIAALASGALSFAIIIPCMDEVWFTGPIAKTTGDIGFEVGFVASILLYIPLRTLEKKLTGR